MDPDLQGRWAGNPEFDSSDNHICELGLSATPGSCCGSAGLAIHGTKCKCWARKALRSPGKPTTESRYPGWLLSHSVDLTYLLCSFHSKGKFLLGIFSQRSTDRYLLLICQRIIIIKKVIAGKIHRGGNELPHSTSVLRLGVRVVTTVRPEAAWQKAELHWEPSKRGKVVHSPGAPGWTGRAVLLYTRPPIL